MASKPTYHFIINDVVNKMRPEFERLGYDEAILNKMKTMWEQHLNEYLDPSPQSNHGFHTSMPMVSWATTTFPDIHTSETGGMMHQLLMEQQPGLSGLGGLEGLGGYAPPNPLGMIPQYHHLQPNGPLQFGPLITDLDALKQQTADINRAVAHAPMPAPQNNMAPWLPQIQQQLSNGLPPAELAPFNFHPMGLPESATQTQTLPSSTPQMPSVESLSSSLFNAPSLNMFVPLPEVDTLSNETETETDIVLPNDLVESQRNAYRLPQQELQTPLPPTPLPPTPLPQTPMPNTQAYPQTPIDSTPLFSPEPEELPSSAPARRQRKAQAAALNFQREQSRRTQQYNQQLEEDKKRQELEREIAQREEAERLLLAQQRAAEQAAHARQHMQARIDAMGGDADVDEDSSLSELDPEDELNDGDENITDTLICTFEKVQRTKNKWKLNLKDGVLTVNGKDYLFQRANGEGEW